MARVLERPSTISGGDKDLKLAPRLEHAMDLSHHCDNVVLSLAYAQWRQMLQRVPRIDPIDRVIVPRPRQDVQINDLIHLRAWLDINAPEAFLARITAAKI